MSDKYEHPKPILTTDLIALDIETKDSHRGKFLLKNTGGGTLKCTIFSRCKGLTFSPEEFESNSQEVSFVFNAQSAGLGIGETVSSRFFIMSNGGEKEIPVTAKLIKMSIATSDGHVIANIWDFYEYSLTHPSQARRLFIDSEFYMLLLASGYEYMEVYESLHKDANRERAMDNFFILSGLKSKTEISIVDDSTLEFSQAPGNATPITGSFEVQKSDSGFAESPLTLRTDAPWLKLSSGKLGTADFENNISTVGFTIDPALIENNFAREQICVADRAIEIVYRRLPPLILKLNRDTYRYADRGTIEVINNTGATMQVGVFCPENYIRFSARSFPIGARGEIPFEVKLSAFMNAQMLFRKLPYMQTSIEISATVPGEIHKKTLPITIGEW
ncbi:MAG: DUF5717 family protein [Defluviitaleaceae bacterium]|nr:DUF5717 family protein [Defluviitaleaceae bacterium]